MTTKNEPLYPRHAESPNVSVPAAPELLEEPAIGTADVVDRLEASVRELRLALHEAQTDVRDLLALKTRADLAERQRAMWEEDALRYCRNEAYYRGLVVAIGEPFGVSAKTSDDGSLQQDVLCAKVPELVAALRERSQRALGLLLEADKTTPSGSREEILIREAITLLGGTP